MSTNNHYYIERTEEGRYAVRPKGSACRALPFLAVSHCLAQSTVLGSPS